MKMLFGLFLMFCTLSSFAQTVEQMTEAPIVGRTGHSAISTGSALIIWGGHTSENGFPLAPQKLLNDGAVFDVKTKTWKLISTLNAPTPRTRHYSALISGKMYIIGGCDKWEGPRCENQTLTGSVYDPISDIWKRIVDAPPKIIETNQPGVVGDRYWVFYGQTVVNLDFEQSVIIYDSKTDHWTQSVAPIFPYKNSDGYSVGFGDINSSFAGEEILGILREQTGAPPKMALYSPFSATWSSIPSFSEFNSCNSPRMCWTAGKFFVVGSDCDDAKGSTSTSIWERSTNQWKNGSSFPLSTYGSVQVVTNSKYLFAYDIVLKENYQRLYDIYRYDIQDDRWAKIGENTIARTKQIEGGTSSVTAVGESLIIWGGRQQNLLALYSNDGIIIGH